MCALIVPTPLPGTSPGGSSWHCTLGHSVCLGQALLLSPTPAAARHCCTLTTQGVLWMAASLGLLSSVSPGRAREKRSRANVLPMGVSVPLNLKLADLGSVTDG